MFKSIMDFLNNLFALLKAMKPSDFEKKEEAKKSADTEGQKFWDKRNL